MSDHTDEPTALTWRALLDRVEDPELDSWAADCATSRADATIAHLKVIATVCGHAIRWIEEDRPLAGGEVDTVQMLESFGTEVARWFGQAFDLLTDKQVAA